MKQKQVTVEKKQRCMKCRKALMNRLYIRDKISDYLDRGFEGYGGIKNEALAEAINQHANEYKKRKFHAIGWYCKKCKSVELSSGRIAK